MKTNILKIMMMLLAMFFAENMLASSQVRCSVGLIAWMFGT